MSNLTLALEAATLVLTISGRSFTLKAPKSQFSIPGTPGAPRDVHVHFQFHEPYENALDLGTAQEIITEVQNLLPELPPPPAGTPAAATLLQQWDDVRANLAKIPILSDAAANVAETLVNTKVGITDIGIELHKPRDQAKYNGKFTLGLMFTPAATAPIRLFRLQVTAFGAVLSVEIKDLDPSNWTLPA